jgi:ABC-type Fe3+ transport system permease subunit
MYGSDPGPRRYGPLHSHVPHERKNLFYWTLIFPGYALLWWRAYFGRNAIESWQASRAVYNRPAAILTSIGVWAVVALCAFLLLGLVVANLAQPDYGASPDELLRHREATPASRP